LHAQAEPSITAPITNGALRGPRRGEVPEWSNGAVSKTVACKPRLSA